MAWSLSLVAPPAEPPVSLDEAKKFLRVTHSVEDDLIASLVEAATLHTEEFCRRKWVAQTWRLTLDDFPACGWIDLPLAPAQSITAVKYLDANGDEQTFDSGSYSIDAAHLPPRLLLGYGESWPGVRVQWNAAWVDFVAGYGSASQVPANAKLAIKMLMADPFEHREARLETRVEDNPTVTRLLWPLRVLAA